MSDFTQQQEQLLAARKDRIAVSKSVFRSGEKLKKLQRQKEKSLRKYGKDSDAYKQLAALEKEQGTVLANEKTQLNTLLGIEQQGLEAFIPFTDPRIQVKEFSDDIPILMFPLRIETRFKQVDTNGGAVQHQLWVRVFPDECSIDTFDDILSEAEISKARRYWIDVWKAGAPANDAVKPYIDNKRRGAWRDLMGLFKAGRAYWVEQNYQPENHDDIPTRTNNTDLIVVIPAETLPENAQQDALRTYWTAYLLANGNEEQIDIAFTTLITTLGGDDAATELALSLVDTYKPDNLDKIVIDPANLPDIQVAFLQFPKTEDFDSKLAAWSQAAKVTTLPERLVLLGFHDHDADPIEELGHIIPDPLIVGPDPGEDINETLIQVFGPEFENLSDDVKAEKYIEYLSTQSQTRWMFDFDEAVSKGMGFKVDIDALTYRLGISRLFVLGVKLSADKTEAKDLLEKLLKNHHQGESGFAILPQGAATNNTENSPSAYSSSEDPDEAYDRYYAETAIDDPDDKDKKLDGRWLADLLGIDKQDSTLVLASGYDYTDQCEARAMNTALWNATIGFFMESMLTPVFDESQRELTRWFLINHVSGRGKIPAIRIGSQPYGILPVSKVSNMRWIGHKRTPFSRTYRRYNSFLKDAYNVIKTVRDDWEGMLDKVAYVGKQGDQQEILLQALGLHANSVEFDQRYAESFEHLFNRLKAEGFVGSFIAALISATYNPLGMELLQKLGYGHDEEENPEIPILTKFFLTKENDVNKPLIDDQELSETDTIRVYTKTDQNYIEWLIDNARNNHKNIKDQKGFINNKVPYALLYDMLRHALNLEFSNAGLKLYLNAEILDVKQVAQAKIDAPFIGVEAQSTYFESKWDLLYRQDSRITGTNALITDHISELIKTSVVNSQTQNLHEVIAALEHLKDTPTAKLERAFVEHLDLCTYRLDSWLLGLVNLQLNAMRFSDETNNSDPTKGIYLGAFGWLENLKPDNKQFTDPDLPDELADIFDTGDGNAPMRDSTNEGYVHAPSINHALTAAVLRNAYISNADKDNADTYKVNVSSERVRMAMSILEGIQQGQSLAALLGYQLERGLHDNNELELDLYIYELRKVFSLNSNKLLMTAIKLDKVGNNDIEKKRIKEEKEELEESKAISKIEARNVVNGLALLDHIRKTGNKEYPFGFPTGTGVGKLASANQNIKDAINAEVERLMNIRDAVADLGISEGVHQVVQGNYDRGSAALDTYSKGAYPQLPEVAKSHTSGIGLTHRFGVHLQSGIVPGAGDNPRVKMEPAVNHWLVDLFPALQDIVCHVEYNFPKYDEVVPPPTEKNVLLSELGLNPIDILYMLGVETDKNLTALDDYILKFVHEDDSPRPDVEIHIYYTRHIDGKISFFELAPLVDNLRTLIIKSRPLKATDIALQNDAAKNEITNNTLPINSKRIKDTNNDMFNFAAVLTPNVINILFALVDLEDFTNTQANQTAIFNQIDNVIDRYIAQLFELSRFAIPESGFGYVYDRKAEIYKAVYLKVLQHKKRWEDKDTQYQDLINNQLPAATTDDKRIEILKEAERTFSTDRIIPVPAIPAFLTHLSNIKTDFDSKFADFPTFLGDKFLHIKDLFDAVASINTDLDKFDILLIDVEEEEKMALVLAEDIYKHAESLVTLLTAKRDAVQALLNQADTEADIESKNKLLTEAVKKIFGKDFVVVPEFVLSSTQANELQQSFDDIDQLLDYQKNTLNNDFPVDDWLYGVARVREKLAAWENLIMLAEGFKDRASIDLTPTQLPFTEDDHWLGLSYPEDHVIDSDRLLYTAYMPGFAPHQSQCGLMVDEWTEVIPHRNETTGLCFHYDQPNSEPPQAMLLMTPSEFTGEWHWSDLVDTLHDTLDLAQIRAIEPDHIDESDYARFLPATVATVTAHPVTIALNYLLQSGVTFDENGNSNE